MSLVTPVPAGGCASVAAACVRTLAHIPGARGTLLYVAKSPGAATSVTYCPLTWSAIGFKGALKGGKATTFGRSGQLVNSNLLM
ncbi:MAG: DUF3179 domain-containing protein [Armatimonadetes bacterium]|nr:DUF3179 domain-containing protein [Armatimonadota bacterium]